ncbi:hypothetical protein AB0B27_16595 [Micromonospora rifamycinica]|uniref:lipopolysaccharide biosynthesis protein n=1 Tax=Micromonospora rifamycinica TaxID=291594 RepID=UPI003405A054
MTAGPAVGSATPLRHAPTDPANPTGGTAQPSLLLRTAFALMSSTVASAALGFVFWLVAARWFPPERVGWAAAAISSMALLAGLAQLNLTSLFARFLPAAGARSRRLILAGYAASAAMAVLLTAGFLGLGLLSGVIGSQPVEVLAFVAAVVASAIFFIQDGVLAALRRPGLVPVKNVLASAGKLALLPLLAGTAAGYGLLLAWTVPMLVTMLAVNWWILTRLAPAQRTATSPRLARREMFSFASAEYVNGTINNTLAFLPPVLVVSLLGPVPSAYFHLPWVIGVAGTTVLWNVVTSFVVQASSDGEGRIRAHIDRAVLLVALVTGLAMVTLVAAATPLLGLLGPDYAANGADALRLIGLSLPFTGVVLLYAAFAMMEKRMWRMVLVQSIGAVICLGGTVLGLPRFGIAAPALALLVGQAVTAAVLVPGLVRRYRATAVGPVDDRRDGEVTGA